MLMDTFAAMFLMFVLPMNSLAKLPNNIRCAGMSLEEMRERLMRLTSYRGSGWKLRPTTIRYLGLILCTIRNFVFPA